MNIFNKIVVKYRMIHKDLHPNTVFIIVDTREKRSDVPKYLHELSEKFEKKRANGKNDNNYLEIIEHKLDVGDYLLSGGCGLERKRGDDFYASLTKGSQSTNLFEELHRLIEGVSQPLLIIENENKAYSNWGNRSYKAKALSYLQVKNAKLSIQTILNIPIIYTENELETAKKLYEIAYYLQNKKDSSGISRSIPKNRSPFERQRFFVEGFFDVARKKSKELLMEFKTPMELAIAIINTDILYTRTGNPKGVSGKFSELKGYGWKFIQKNKELLLFDNTKELEDKKNAKKLDKKKKDEDG